MTVYYTTMPVESRAFLREVLAREGASACEILRTPNGKPYLLDGSLQISLTHTKGLLAVAVSEQAVGIDAERRIPRKTDSILARLTPLEREEDFFTLWTAKEAYIKLCGGTLADMLPSLSFERGALLLGGAPLAVTLKHCDLEGCTLCICTKQPETVTFAKL